MHQSLARYSALVSLVHAPSWADFITAMVGFKVFGTHRRGELRSVSTRRIPADPLWRLNSMWLKADPSKRRWKRLKLRSARSISGSRTREFTPATALATPVIGGGRWTST